jgi:hypothetical protein
MSADYEYRGLMAENWDLLRGDTSGWPDAGWFRTVVEQGAGPALDVGCGTGRTLLDFLAQGLDIDGLDKLARDASPLPRQGRGGWLRHERPTVLRPDAGARPATPLSDYLCPVDLDPIAHRPHGPRPNVRGFPQTVEAGRPHRRLLPQRPLGRRVAGGQRTRRW